MLLQRVLSAAVGILYIFFMLYFGGWFFKISVFIMSFILMHEFYHAFAIKGYKPIKWLGYILIFLLFYSNFINQWNNSIILIMSFTIIGLIIPIFDKKLNIMDVFTTIFAAFYPGMMVFFLIFLGFQASPYGMNLLICTFLVTWSTDTFAYFVGRAFGKNKLCPSISPNKTVEGSLGGLIGSIIVSTIFGLILNNSINLDVHLYHFGIIGLLGGILSQFGDLCASSIKRYCGIKDFGNLLPGHGGLLDRFDSLLFVMPAIYIYYLTFLV
ncbi:MAG: phosphatidate cytidylyltransferase [Clostridiales bacterium]|nr:phosphatidate cytidylyltransferase [Clostridiales bacterium]